MSRALRAIRRQVPPDRGAQTSADVVQSGHEPFNESDLRHSGAGPIYLKQPARDGLASPLILMHFPDTFEYARHPL